MPNLTIYLLVGLFSAVIAAGGGYYVAHEKGRAEMLEVQYRMAEASALAQMDARIEQKRVDDIALTAAQALATTTLNIDLGTVTIIEGVERHVTDRSACVTWGLVRVLDAAVLGRSPDDLALPAGVDENACAPTQAVALAKSVTANYGACRANAAQLDAVTTTVGKWEQ